MRALLYVCYVLEMCVHLCVGVRVCIFSFKLQIQDDDMGEHDEEGEEVPV